MTVGERFRAGDDTVFLAELLSGSTIKDAASKSGMSESTGRRRYADPEFQRKYHAARAEVRDRVVARLTGAADRAVSRQLALLDDPMTPPAVARNVARDIMELFDRFAEGRDLGHELEEIRAQLEALGPARRVA